MKYFVEEVLSVAPEAAGIAINLVEFGEVTAVHRARHAGVESAADLVVSATAGEVFYSAMTTTLSFGTLALSGHQGMHTLGVALTIGMFWTVVSNLVVLPAVLTVSGFSAVPERGAAERA